MSRRDRHGGEGLSPPEVERGLSSLLDVGAAGPAEPLDELSRRRFVEQVFDGLAADRGVHAEDASTESSSIWGADSDESLTNGMRNRPGDAARVRPRFWLGALGAVAAAVLLGFGVSSLASSGLGSGSHHAVSAASGAPGAPMLDTEVPRLDPLSFGRGHAASPAQLVEAPPGSRVALELPGGVELWLAGSSVARIEGDRIRLVRGTVLARVAPREAGSGFVIATDRVEVEVIGTLYAVELVGDEVDVRVHSGQVRVTSGTSKPVEVGAGEALRVGSEVSSLGETQRRRDLALIDELAPADSEAASEADVTEVVPAAGEVSRSHKPLLDDLVLDATRLRGRRQWKAAAATYRDIRRHYPRSAEACTAALSLGQLQLDHLGEARAALATFESHGRNCEGAQLEESDYGRARALRTLGRAAAERKALVAFVEDHSGSLRKSEVETRIADLDRSKGRCAEAEARYSAVLRDSPGAKIERRARLGLAECALKAGDEGPARRFIQKYPEAEQTKALRARLP